MYPGCGTQEPPRSRTSGPRTVIFEVQTATSDSPRSKTLMGHSDLVGFLLRTRRSHNWSTSRQRRQRATLRPLCTLSAQFAQNCSLSRPDGSALTTGQRPVNVFRRCYLRPFRTFATPLLISLDSFFGVLEPPRMDVHDADDTD